MNRLGTFILLFSLFGSTKLIERMAQQSSIALELDDSCNVESCIDCQLDEQAEIEFAVLQIEQSLKEMKAGPTIIINEIPIQQMVEHSFIDLQQLDTMLDKFKKLYLLKKLILQKPKDELHLQLITTDPYLVPLTIDAHMDESKVQQVSLQLQNLKSHQKYMILKFKQIQIKKKIASGS